MDLFSKFIIEEDSELGDCLIISKCIFHKELVTNKKKVKGGGFYKVDIQNKTFTLYGESHDFGKVKIKDVEKCIENDRVFTNTFLIESIAKEWDFIINIEEEKLLS